MAAAIFPAAADFNQPAHDTRFQIESLSSSLAAIFVFTLDNSTHKINSTTQLT